MKHYLKRIILTLLLLFIAAILFLVLDSSGLIMKKTVDVDTLYAGYQPDLALPGPEFASEAEYRELDLNDTYLKSALTESTSVSEDEKLAVINKWSNEIYPCFGSFMLASAMDSLTHQTGKGILSSSSNTRKTANSISLWAENMLQHTQHFPAFQKFQGKDPWGALNLFGPVYKKVLPSEMLAKSAYTGKITGKCCSLAALNMGIFAVAGADPENIVILRYDTHEVGIVKYDGLLYISNNESIDPIDDVIKEHLLKQQYKGFFNYSISIVQNFKLSEAFFSSDTTLLESITALTNTGDKLPRVKLLSADTMQNRNMLHARVFGNTEDVEHNRLFTLARYAYQSLYVKEPALYLRASIRAPVIKELAKKLKSEKDIINWIKSNIAYAPLFDDYTERLMIADQVVVFKKGGPKDQAVLAWSLLKLNGIDSVIKITDRTAYLETSGVLYDTRIWNTVEAVQGDVLVELKTE